MRGVAASTIVAELLKLRDRAYDRRYRYIGHARVACEKQVITNIPGEEVSEIGLDHNRVRRMATTVTTDDRDSTGSDRANTVGIQLTDHPSISEGSRP